MLETLVLRALAHQVRGDLSSALATLKRALACGEPEGYARSFLDEGPPVAALLAALIDASGRSGHDGLSPSVAACAGRLLARFAAARSEGPGSEAASLPSLPESLTPREREVLELIAAGLSNPEIAARLFIGVGTVKSHVNNLFGKLPAASRTQAVARARALGLLPP